jgi:hydrogenase maturation protease
MKTRAEEVAQTVLYEGYILYPYRPSSVKNQQRWNFGVAYPPHSSEGAASMQTQCLAIPHSNDPELDVKVQFLHLTDRAIRQLDTPVSELPDGAEPASRLVDKIECGCRIYQSWHEGVEQETILPGCRLNDIVARPIHQEFILPASRTVEPVRDAKGRVALLIVRERHALTGAVEVSAERAADDVVRLTIRLENRTSVHDPASDRDGALLRSLVSAHEILTLRGAEFISLIDPPEPHAQLAEECENTGTFPVLAGEEGQRDVMLSSPIILYDYPQIAPESAGDLCDGTEIDEILSLRILTLTDEEKREMRQSDERGRRILERTEAMPEEQWLKLHGVLRGLRPHQEASR